MTERTATARAAGEKVAALPARRRFSVDEYYRLAEAGIPEVWLVDLTSDRVLIHRDPSATGYRSIATIGRDDVLSPAAFPDLHLPVAELLPG